LHSAISQLRDAQHKREETLRFLSHDMRSPQNSILALTQLQRNEQAALPTHDMLDRIEQYANKTLVLVDGFIQFARADAAQLAQDTINLAELLTQCADDFWAQAQQRHIRITGKDGPDPAWVVGDSAMLTRVFCNLLDNALKYSPDNTLITWGVEAGNNTWTVRISDQGRGMTSDQLNSLFVPFIRLDEDTPNNASGAGLGLAFVKTVIERHGGSVWAESEKNRGSTFIVILPASET
jgi:signal transduction histidine kinase